MLERYISRLPRVLILALFGLSLFSGAVFAHNKVVVVPLFDSGEPTANVITVAKRGGDFTDPVAAMASITNASEANPYLIQLAPGIYQINEPIRMKSHVRVAGSGIDTSVITRTHTTEPFDLSSAFLLEYPTGVTGSKLSNLSLGVEESNQSSINISYAVQMQANSSATWDSVDLDINFSLGITAIRLRSASLNLQSTELDIRLDGTAVWAHSSRLKISNSKINSPYTSIQMLGNNQSRSRLEVLDSTVIAGNQNPAIYLADGGLIIRNSEIYTSIDNSSSIEVQRTFPIYIENSLIRGSLDFSNVSRANISNVGLVTGEITATSRAAMFCNNVVNYSNKERLNSDCSNLE